MLFTRMDAGVKCKVNIVAGKLQELIIPPIITISDEEATGAAPLPADDRSERGDRCVCAISVLNSFTLSSFNL